MTVSYIWQGCNVGDVCSFLALVIYFGILPAPNLAYYWRTDHTMVLPKVHSVMSKRRFLGMQRYFHAFNRRAVPRGNKDRLILIRPVFDYIQG